MKTALQRNLKGPRFRNKMLQTTSDEWLTEIVNSSDCLVKDKNVVKTIIVDTNKAIADLIIELRDGVELPEQLGHMFLGTCQPKIRKNVDFKTTDNYLKVIQHRNWESDNYLAKIFYTNYSSKYKFKFHELWGFKGCREFTRKVGKTYPENWKKYIQVDYSLKVSRLYRNYLKDVNRMVLDKERLQDYNPLEL
jgi:hypothetical protein